MKILRKYCKSFFLHGIVAMGFGPIVLSVVYGILSLCGVIDTMKASEVVLSYLTITFLAFLCGGITVVYQIEELAISKAITAHGIILYIAYAVVYLVNDWLRDGMTSFIVFTIIFVLGYVLTWIVIYCITKSKANKLNSALKNRAE